MRCTVSAVLTFVVVASALAADDAALRAYPDPVPEDVAFDDVVRGDPFPRMKYPVPIVGARVHPEEIHVTPSGELIFPQGANWSGPCVAMWIGSRPAGQEGAKEISLGMPPADEVRSRLTDGYLPAVENQWTVDDLEIGQLAFAVEGDGFEPVHGQKPLLGLVRYTVKNKSSAPRETVLAIQFGRAELNMSVKAAPPASPAKLSFEPPFVRAEDGSIVACLLTGEPKAAFKSLSAPSVPTGSVLWMECALAPGESKTVEMAVPYFPLPAESGRRLEALRLNDELGRFRAFWTRELDRNAQFIVPEERIRDGYRACLANNLLLIDRDAASGALMPHPDAKAYEAVWAGDGSVSIQAMDRMGFHKEAESMLEYFLARQGKDQPEGDVSSAEGFFNGDVGLKWMNQNGFVLWAMAEHYKLTRDEKWLRRVAGQLIAGCDWIARERARTKLTENGQKVKHFGLLPKGRPSDLYIWDNWYWTDAYSYMGLRGVADALAAIGMKDEASRLAAEADDYKACIVQSVERSVDPNVKPPFLPPSPYRTGPPSFDFFKENWYTLCSPVYMVEAGLLDAGDEKIGGTCHWLEKYGLYSGMPNFEPGTIDPYYVYNQSLAQLLRGESAKFAWTLYSISAFAMGPGTFATIECHNLVTGCNSEAWDVNCQPHMHSNSRYIDLVRIALVLEDRNTLHLMAGAPRGWLADGQTIEVRRAPSYFGPVNYTARSRVASGEIAIQIEPLAQPSPEVVLHVRPPTKHGSIKSVKVDGEEWTQHDGESVRLPRLDKKTNVICVF
ncbi:MAG: hypothetical protein JW809_05250 [Pirellulales bacterium]|nr:hypothetical protein [Pirellulales bacterium]